MSRRNRDPLAGNSRHANSVRRIHGRREVPLCSDCSGVLTYERDIGECSGRTVSECGRCGWNDFDVQQLAYVRSLDSDPGFSTE